MAPEWLTASFADSSVRPTLMATTGMSRSRAFSSAAIKPLGLRTVSRNSATTLVVGWSSA
ncbi:hypothetical protein D3C83_183280 [compost metagenome]